MASAYIKDEQGGTFIPASQRPDGTWRKPRRVKDGYIPQEEVPLYESKGKQFIKNKPLYPVGASAEYIAELKARQEAAAKVKGTPGLIKTETKKKKRKSKNKGVDKITEDLGNTAIGQSNETKDQSAKNQKQQSNNKQPAPTSTEKSNTTSKTNQSQSNPQKRLKSLKKKLREIETLEEKIKTGTLKNPEKDILDKLARKNEIEKEIKELEKSQ